MTMPGTAITIALIEGQRAISDLLESELLRSGFQVRAAGESEATQLIDGGEFDLVVLDVDTPSIQGWKLLERLRASEPLGPIPVIIASTTYSRPGWKLLPAGGPVLFSHRPFDVAEVLASISTLLHLV